VSPTSTQLEGADVLSALSQPLDFSYNQSLDTGTSYSLGFGGVKSSTNSQFRTVNPSIDASMDFSASQALLRNRGRRVNRLTVMVAQTRFHQSRYNLQDQILGILAFAENTYWSVIEARESLRVNEEALRLNEALLKRAERELELGAISPLDIYQPQQNRASAEIFVTQATYRLAQSLDALRRQIGADLDPDFQTMPIVLTEPVLPPDDNETIDPESMVELAYKSRPDLMSVAQNVKIDDLNYDIAKNDLRPDLSLGVFYSSKGLGGNVGIFDNSEPPILIGVSPGGLGDALGQIWRFNYPTYGFSLTLQLPVRDRRAVANLADAAVSKRLDTLRIRQAEQDARLEVLNAVNQLEGSKARVKLSQTQLDFSQKRLEAEQKKYDLGVTTIFLLIQAQNDLASAQSDLVTQAAQYRRSLTSLLQVTGQLLERRGVTVQ
jgi:outer membrane protein TolC